MKLTETTREALTEGWQKVTDFGAHVLAFKTYANKEAADEPCAAVIVTPEKLKRARIRDLKKCASGVVTGYGSLTKAELIQALWDVACERDTEEPGAQEEPEEEAMEARAQEEPEEKEKAAKESAKKAGRVEDTQQVAPQPVSEIIDGESKEAQVVIRMMDPARIMRLLAGKNDARRPSAECPDCKIKTKTVTATMLVFGYRTIGGAKVIPQSFCRNCRAAHARERRSKK